MQISPQFIKKTIDTKKRIMDPLVLYPNLNPLVLYPKFELMSSNVAFLIKSIKILTTHCLEIATGRDTALNIYWLRCLKISNLFNSFQVFQATGNTEQKFVHLLANGNISLLAYLRDLSWVSFYLIYTCVIFFCLWLNLM